MERESSQQASPDATPERHRGALRFTLLAMLGSVLLLAIWVFRAFLLVSAVAAAVAIFLAPLHARLRRGLGERATLSAGLLTALTAGVILVPIASGVTVLSRQAPSVFGWLRPQLEPAALRAQWQALPERVPVLKALADLDAEVPAQALSQALSALTRGVNAMIQGMLAGLTSAALDLVLFLMILFFLLRDGPQIGRELRSISPLSEAQESELVEHIARTMRGMALATVAVPVTQATVALLGFLIFGVPSPLFWSFTVLLAALIPLLGSPLGWLPACGYLLATGAATWQWLGLLLYGLLVISASDNLVKPMLLRDSAQIHPMLGFLAILGGFFSFGPLGLVIGPIILSLLLSALRIYRLDILEARPSAAAAPSAAERADPAA